MATSNAKTNPSDKAPGRGRKSPVKNNSENEQRASAIQLYHPKDLPENRPILANGFEITGMIVASGNRPIASSALHISETLAGNRPVEASNFEVRHLMGNRPIGASLMQVSEIYKMSGSRPVAVSNLHISDLYSVMGNRPIASNEIDDSATLMGFID